MNDYIVFIVEMSSNNAHNDKKSDFVTPEVTKALNQARQIVTTGKTEEDEHVIEESTTVNVGLIF